MCNICGIVCLPSAVNQFNYFLWGLMRAQPQITVLHNNFHSTKMICRHNPGQEMWYFLPKFWRISLFGYYSSFFPFSSSFLLQNTYVSTYWVLLPKKQKWESPPNGTSNFKLSIFTRDIKSLCKYLFLYKKNFVLFITYNFKAYMCKCLYF